MEKTAAAWDSLAKKYRTYIKLERRLSDNTVEAYMHDLELFSRFVLTEYGISPEQVEPAMVEAFMADLYDRAAERTTQGRVLSGVRSFYNFLLTTERIEESPMRFIERPRAERVLPDTLAVEEIDAIIGAAARGACGVRNRAMLEMLYSCGLRVAELVGLRLSDLFFDEGVVRVTGKGDKQRLVPVSDAARRTVERYLTERAALPRIDPQSVDTVFLNRRGRRLSRVMVFNIIREAAAVAGIDKKIGPHTFRHSFATHLLQGGASVRQVQEMLGHASILTTEIYTHLDTRHLHRVVDEHHPLG